ncbi:MAG: amidohydrolase family protein [Balneolales bacterium]
MGIPGFADLQVNGYKGVDFSSPELTREAFVYACRELIRQGTVLFLPTVITSSVALYKQNLGLIAGAIEHKDLKQHIPGIHLEGPFISGDEGVVGAHNPDWVQKPTPAFLDELCTWANGKVKLLTIAAETEGAAALCAHARGLGITVSLGHQMATGEDLANLARSGAVSLTHLGNGLPKTLHRHDNPLWHGIANDSLKAMIITDGHHLPPSIIKTILRTKGSENVIVVSDASPIAGLPPGKYNTLGNDVVLEKSGHLYNPQTGYLVGSSSSMIDCMNYLLSLKLLDTRDLFKVGFFNPLKLIHIDPQRVMDTIPPQVGKNGPFVIL